MVTFQPIKNPSAADAADGSFPQNVLSAALICEDEVTGVASCNKEV
jgi:hypothetical protein